MSAGQRDVAARLGHLILISDATRLGEERFLAVLVAAVRGGVRAVQVREKTWDEERVRRLVRRIRGEAGAPVAIVLNGSPRLALDLAATGVHVGGGDPRAVGRARAEVGPELLVGYSAHEVGELSAAAAEGVDYVSFSPVFTPISKSGEFAVVGLAGLREAVRAASVPVYALGGVRAGDAAGLYRSGAAGAAVIGALTGASDPAAVARAFLAAWGGKREPEKQPRDESAEV